MENYDKPIVNRIDIDEKTAEPIIVEVSEKELIEKEKRERKAKLEKYSHYDFVERKSNKSIGKQLAMNRIFGVQKDESINKRQKFYKNLFTIIFIVFVVAVLAFTAYNDFFGASEEREPFSWDLLLTVFLSSWQHFLLALLALLLCYLLKGAKLSIMCKSITKKWHFITCCETGIIGHYYNSVTPLAVGGQPFEIYHLAKHGVGGGHAAALPIATYFLNQIAFVILGIVGLALAPKNPLFSIFPAVFKVMAIIGLFCCVILPLLVIIFSMMPRVGAVLVHLVMHVGSKLKIVKRPKETTYKTIRTVVQNSKCIKAFTKRPHAFISTFILSFLEQISFSSIAYFTLMFFGFKCSLVQDGFMGWLQIVQVCIILNAAISFIPTPGNSGAADLSFYILFQSGLAVGLAFPAMVLWRGLSFYSYIIIGFIFATLKKKSDTKKALSNTPPANN
jgi:uncharacterized protein (TIRG00374 family)